MQALEASELRFSYGRAVVVSSLSFTLHRSEVLAIVGANGAGKSTTALGIAGLLTQRSGSLLMEGRRLDKVPTEKRVAAGLVLVPETRALFGGLTVEDNLMLGGFRLKHRPKLDPVLDIFPDLADRLRQHAKSLSGGQQQMLAIGRALMSHPKVLILDEPSLGLAPLITEQIMGVVRQLADNGLSVILIEQNLVAALEVADSALVLERGEAILNGSADDVKTDPAVMAAYLGGGK